MSSPAKTSSPNPHAPLFRPAPARAATLSAGYPYKSRAASQPAGERLPAPSSQPGSGSGSPGNGGAYGVIGGSRTPVRYWNALVTGGTTTRANSFSAGEMREPRDQRVCRVILWTNQADIPRILRSRGHYPLISRNILLDPIRLPLSPHSRPTPLPQLLPQHFTLYLIIHLQKQVQMSPDLEVSHWRLVHDQAEIEAS